MTFNRRPSGRAWVTALLVLGAFAAGGAVGVFVLNREPAAASGDGSRDPGADRPARVTALGRLQPAGGVVPVAGPPGDRIETMEPRIAPGTLLQDGQLIATLASYAQRKRELEIAEQQLAEAEDQLKKARAAGQKRIAVAKAEVAALQANKASDLAALKARVDLAEVQAKIAGKAVERLQTLRTGGVKVSDEEVDRAALQRAQADAERTAADAAYKKAETSYAESEKTADAKVAAAEAELAEAESKVGIGTARKRVAAAEKVPDLSLVKAPIAGTVLKVNARPGQPTGFEPILQMADLTRMDVVAEVYESDVGRVMGWVRAGPVSAEVTNPALPRPLSGTVATERDIARVIARNQVFPGGPREDADRRVVEVVVHLDGPSSELAARFVGLQVTVTLTPGK